MTDRATTTFFRTGRPRAKNLLIVNKGPAAVGIEREGDQWDLLEIYFAPGDIERLAHKPALTDADYVIFETNAKLRKFAIVKKIFAMSDFRRAYDAIMIADDDLVPVGCRIADMFDLFAKTGCRVGQPALTQDSYFFHFITIRNDLFAWRKTNFAEIMCPMFTQSALDDYLPVFDGTATAYGLDYYWGHHETRRGGGVAMLDATPMRHCRPVGSANPTAGLELPHQEFWNFLNAHKIPRYPHLCLDGVAARDRGTPELFAASERLGLSVAGYGPNFTKDPKFIAYVENEIAEFRKKFG